MTGRPARGALTIALLATLVAAASAQADPVADFYRGKTINLVVGTSAGNDYDFRGRLIARHMGRHIPGEPIIAPQNMPGAGGIKAANYMAAIAPKDGTTVHMIMTNMMATQVLHLPGVEFDTRQFRWIGNTTSSPNVVNSWHTSGITKIEEVKTRELVVGAPKGTAGVIYATLLNKLAGMKFKIVTGYPGGNEVNIAMKRSEVLGRGSNSWASWKSTKPEWPRGPTTCPRSATPSSRSMGGVTPRSTTSAPASAARHPPRLAPLLPDTAPPSPISQSAVVATPTSAVVGWYCRASSTLRTIGKPSCVSPSARSVSRIATMSSGRYRITPRAVLPWCGSAE